MCIRDSFQVDLEPVTADTQLAQSEASAQEAAAVGDKLMRVSVKVSSGSQMCIRDINNILLNLGILRDAVNWRTSYQIEFIWECGVGIFVTCLLYTSRCV